MILAGITKKQYCYSAYEATKILEYRKKLR